MLKSSFNEIVWVSKYNKYFNLIGCKVACTSKRVDAFSSGVNVTIISIETSVAVGVLMRVVCYADIMSTTKGWPIAGVGVDCFLLV